MNWIKLEEELPPPNVLVWIKRTPTKIEEVPIYLGKRPAKPLTSNPDASKDCYWRAVYSKTLLYVEQDYSGVLFTSSFSDVTVLEWAYIEIPT